MGSNNSRERSERERSEREMERINLELSEKDKQEKKEEMLNFKKFSIINNPNMKIEFVKQKTLCRDFKYCNIILIFLLNKNNELKIMLLKRKNGYIELVLSFNLIDLKIKNEIKLFKEEFKDIELIDNKLEIKFEKFNIKNLY